MHKAALVLDEAGDGEGRRAAARRITSDEQVLSVLVRSASVVGDGRPFACHHGLHLAKREGFFGAVGGNAKALTKQHSRVLRHTTRRRMLGFATMLTENCVVRTSASNLRTTSTFCELNQRGMDASLWRHLRTTRAD